jgi:hypothetical protein
MHKKTTGVMHTCSSTKRSMIKYIILSDRRSQQKEQWISSTYVKNIIGHPGILQTAGRNNLICWL